LDGFTDIGMGVTDHGGSTGNRRNSPTTATTGMSKLPPDSRLADQNSNTKFSAAIANDEVNMDGNTSSSNKKKKKFAFDTPQEEVFALLLEKKKKQ